MHVRLGAAIALVGLIFTSKSWLLWINTLSPEAGLIVKNLIIFLIIYLLHFVDGFISLPRDRAFGVLLIYIAFNMIFNYQSDWIVEAGANNVSRQTPDGALYHRARNAGLGPDAARIVTFVMAPFLLFMSGSLIIKSTKLNLD